MGNGYKGVVPELTGRQKLYLELTGLPTSSAAYGVLCDWFVQSYGKTRGKEQSVAMQLAMLERIFPNMLGTAELAEYLRQVLTGDKAVWAELVIQRYGLDTEGGACRKMTELVPEFARKHSYSEGTVKSTMGKILDLLRKDAHFREALTVPELSDDPLNYWKFVCILLTGFDRKVEQMDWSEEDAVEAVTRLREVGVSNPAMLDKTVENWLSVLPEEVRLATKMMYGLGYPAIERTEDYIMAASGFDGRQRSLRDFLMVKLNRASLAAIFGVPIEEVNYQQFNVSRSMIADIETLGLPVKVAAALHDGGVRTAIGLLEIDMFSEENQPWTEHVPSKYWRDVVQLWFDLKIRHEIGEYQFNGGGYAYQNVS